MANVETESQLVSRVKVQTAGSQGPSPWTPTLTTSAATLCRCKRSDENGNSIRLLLPLHTHSYFPRPALPFHKVTLLMVI